MKIKNLVAMAVSCVMVAGGMVAFAACGDPEDGGVNSDAKIQLTFWNPITGPDSSYMQRLVKDFNKENEGEIFVKDTANAEETHYQNISLSFNDKSSPDLALIHKSRVPYYEHIGRLNSMEGVIGTIGLNQADYVGDTWTSCEIEGDMYAVPYDVLPTALFYNRKLFPEGKAEAWEAEIRSEDFTVARMEEMMQEVYVYASRPNQRTYGMAFNYASTDTMFISFLHQLGGKIVDPANPVTALYNDAKGVKAAETVKSIPDTMKGEYKVCTESGSDHLTVFKQGRALFTIDGIWSAPGACDPSNGKIDTGVVRLPKVDADATRKVGGDGHCFAMFNTTSNALNDEREAAIAKFVKYMIDRSDYWCEGGKVAARQDVTQSTSYQALEWGHLSNELEYIVSPVKVYTYETIISPIGKHVSNFVESKSEAYATWQAELDAAVSESNGLAAGIN